MQPPIIYTVNESKFKIDGIEYDVSTVSLSLSTNSIPSCAVGIAPTPSAGKAKRTVVHTLSLEDLTNTLKDLQKKAIELKECSLDISLYQDGKIPGLDIDTSLSLHGWLLSGVGLSRVTTTDGFSLVCTIVHPAYRLTLETGVMPVCAGVVDPSQFLSKVKDPLSAGASAIEMCETANEGQRKHKVLEEGSIPTGTKLKTIEEARDAIKDRITALKENAKALLRWDSGGTYVKHGCQIPCENILTGDGMLDGIKLSMLMDWFTLLSQSSYWESLTGAGKIAAEYGVEVLPTYDSEDGKLVVCPAMPWKDAEPARIEVKDEITYAVMLPGQDRDPIFGYLSVVDTAAPAGGLITVQAAASEKTQVVSNIVPFIPDTTKKSTGRLKRVRAPDWLDKARQRASQAKKTSGSTVSRPDNDELAKPQSPAGGPNDQLKHWNPGVFAHLCNRFTLEYKSTVTATLQCAFFTKVGKRTLIPGQRVKFTSGEKTLFYGTIGSVFHMISCPSSSAETQIQLTHCTFVGGADAEVLGKEVKAPYYSASGSVEW